MSVVGKPLNNYQKCIGAYLRCFRACHECAVPCLQELDVTQGTNRIGMTLERVGFCQGAACLMTMNAKHVKETRQLCAMVCEECIVGYAQFKDRHCQQCVDECRKRAAECRAM